SAGNYLAAAHQHLDIDDYGYVIGTDDGLKTSGAETWDAFFHEYVKGLASLLHDSALDRDGLADDVDTVLEHIQNRFPEQPEPSIIHRDYRPGNLRVKDDEITAILDWDNAIAGDAY
ncbi:MAG: phosphotransferase, partial [Candidatus Nanohaloarchaea archaeon]|nr:phosphotransferase [Candidatus Nanohaloarchaea archaeon]